MTEHTVKSLSKLKLSLAIGVPKQKIGSFINFLFGKDFKEVFQQNKFTTKHNAPFPFGKGAFIG